MYFILNNRKEYNAVNTRGVNTYKQLSVVAGEVVMVFRACAVTRKAKSPEPAGTQEPKKQPFLKPSHPGC